MLSDYHPDDDGDDEEDDDVNEEFNESSLNPPGRNIYNYSIDMGDNINHRIHI